MKKQILLTFDLEEFDLPLEFGGDISIQNQLDIACKGLSCLTLLLSKYKVRATFFTTSLFAEKNKELVKSLSGDHEIASHSVSHSGFRNSDPLDSRLEIEKIIGKQVSGFRMPRFGRTDLSLLKEAGYRYDSSINPTFIPGRYNNFRSKRTFYTDTFCKLIEVPVSVLPVVRFPLFWLSFKNMPLPAYINLCKMVLNKDKYIVLLFHPWEFVELKSFNIPGYIKSISGDNFTTRFERLIRGLSPSGEFSTVAGFLEMNGLF